MKHLQLRAATLFAIGADRDTPITCVNDYPPCFESSAAFKQWLRLESGAPVALRKDFPAEPNYCRDCTAEGQAKFIAEGRCLFPNVRFQTVQDVDGDDEVVGYTPVRFLPATVSGSYGHEIELLELGIYQTKFTVLKTGSIQTSIVNRAEAERFAEKWGITVPAEAA